MILPILIVMAIVFVLLIIIIGLTVTKKTTKIKAIDDNPEDIPVKRKKLLSNAEINFYRVLRTVIPEEREISCKCRLEDIMYIENCPKKESYRGKIKNRHVDFIIYNPINGYTDYAIELDDKSHETEKQVKSDHFKNQIFQKIGMPLIRIKAKQSYQPEELKKIIEEETKKTI